MTFCGRPLSRSLLGAKRTCPFALHMSANDPKQTFNSHGRSWRLCSRQPAPFQSCSRSSTQVDYAILEMEREPGRASLH